MCPLQKGNNPFFFTARSMVGHCRLKQAPHLVCEQRSAKCKRSFENSYVEYSVSDLYRRFFRGHFGSWSTSGEVMEGQGLQGEGHGCTQTQGQPGLVTKSRRKFVPSCYTPCEITPLDLHKAIFKLLPSKNDEFLIVPRFHACKLLRAHMNGSLKDAGRRMSTCHCCWRDRLVTGPGVSAAKGNCKPLCCSSIVFICTCNSQKMFYSQMAGELCNRLCNAP